MLRLLKYDLKRDMFMLLGGWAAIVLLLLVIEIGGRYWNMEADVRFVLTVLTYFVAGGGILVIVCTSFRKNIGSISRRLLPVHSWTYIASAGLYALLTGICLLLLGIGQLVYYWQSGVWEELKGLGAVNIKGLEWLTPSLMWFGIPLALLWAVIVGFSALFLAIAVTESLRIKARSLVGVFLFFTMGSLISWIENAFFGGRGTQAIPSIRVENQSVMDLRIQGIDAGLGAFVFEAIVVVLCIWLTIKLIDRRVQMK